MTSTPTTPAGYPAPDAEPASEPPPILPPDDAEAVLLRVRAYGALRTAWLRGLWDAEDAFFAPGSSAHARADSALAAADAPAAEAHWRAGPDAVLLREAAAAADAALDTARRGTGAEASRLARLERMFGLSGADQELLQLAFAVAVDPSVATLCAYLAEQPWASEPLAARIFGHGRPAPWPADSPLFGWRLLERCPTAPGAPDAIVCDPRITAWLLGLDHLDPALVSRARLVPCHDPLSGWPVDETVSLLRRILEADPQAQLRVVVRGLPGSGRHTFAALVAAHAGLHALAVDLTVGAAGSRLGPDQQPDPVAEPEAAEIVVRGTRQAFLDGAAPVWSGLRDWRALAAAPGPFPLEFVVAEPGARPPASPDRAEHVVDMPTAATGDRQRLWAAYLPGAADWPAGELEQLAARFRATPAEICAAAAVAPSSGSEAAEALRHAAADQRATGLAQYLECPFEPADLVVPTRLRGELDDLVFEASERTRFWEGPGPRRLFPTGRALAALFSGPPGTGKTMAAQVIAGRLGFDLWRVDLSTVVSKYVGETAENIERLLRQAAGADVVLLFDEADALYGKRTAEIRDAQDRYVNMDTGHLMVALENHDGVVLLATNHKGAIDPAFLRRLRYVIDFPKPDADGRRHIWGRTLAGLVGATEAERLAPDADLLGAEVEVTGAQIKYAALGGLFTAKREGVPLNRAHLVAGLGRELAKEGRPWSGREVERLVAL
ncbi:ATP-binding protein [Streptomyces sp. NPDC059874]|uniref:ATP-binding protein n=1 Tax=Streptomyces sp. NPDC059874 TaxID=3346983 RepID=UPI00365B4140